MRGWLVGAQVLTVALVASCSGEESGSGGPSKTFDGETLYKMPLADGNTFACGTCHALKEPAPDGFTRPGHPIGDAAKRPSYKNGKKASFLDAVNVCLTEWMNVSKPWTESEPRWKALSSFLEAQSDAPKGQAPTVTITVAQPPTDPLTLMSGDPVKGQATFNGRCIVCHGRDAVGTERAPQLAGAGLMPDYIAKRVRTSGLTASTAYDGLTGGKMPFWGADRLSETELLDVIAFVSQSSAPDAGAGDAGAGDSSTFDSGPCGSTHAKVGQTATLSNFAHGVGGTATIVDDCTIRIDQFNFDGNGIDIRIYGATGGNYSGGFPLSDNLKNFPTGYSNETLSVKVPPDKSLDDVDGISVWCVPVGVSFGDGSFK